MSTQPSTAATGSARDRLVFRDYIRPGEVFFIRRGNDLEIVIVEQEPMMMRGFSTTAFLIPLTLINEDSIDVEALEARNNFRACDWSYCVSVEPLKVYIYLYLGRLCIFLMQDMLCPFAREA